MLQDSIADVQSKSPTATPERHKWLVGGRIQLPPIPLRISERRLLLGVMDVLIVNAALVVSLALRSEYGTDLLLALTHLRWFVLLSVLWLIVAELLDIYDLARSASALHSAWASGSCAVLTGVIYLLIPYITPSLPSSRLEVVVFPWLATCGVVVWRIVYARVFAQPSFCQRALVVGAGWSGRALAQAIAETGDDTPDGGNPYRGTGYRIIGFVDDNAENLGKEIEGSPVLGAHQDLVRLARELHPDELVIAITHAQTIHGGLFQAILDCRELGIQVTTMASLYERVTGRVPVEHAGRDLYVVMPLDRSAGPRLYLAVRRLFDIAVGVVGCALVALLSPVVWLAHQLTAPGDVFYRQERVGKGGQVFKVVKYRSMMMGAEKNTGAVWASHDDCRVTSVGRLLRKTRLDELPQFWNVLKGEMSLIGPRPERPEFVAQLAQEIPFYRVRHAVHPGITGWAQVKYHYGSSVNDSLLKLQYDLYYIKHEGPYLDLLILLKTVQVVLGLKGR